jgi:hypothetical protein
MLMDSKDFIASLGKIDDSREVTGLLAALGVKKKLKMPKDDVEARIDLPKQGLSLIFEPEGPKTSRLAFVAVQFFSDAEEGFKIFKGELPGKLLFTDKQTEVREKLGKPAESKKQFRLDRWKVKGLVLTVEYAKEDGRIGAITIEVPDRD